MLLRQCRSLLSPLRENFFVFRNQRVVSATLKDRGNHPQCRMRHGRRGIHCTISLGAKSSSFKLADLPQGQLGGRPLPSEKDAVGYPTVIKQARNNMRRFEQCLLLTRVGSFYEAYFEQAEELGSMLGIKIASKKTSVGPVAMAGFPFTQLDKYLKVLVQENGKHVAIAEEILNHPSQKVKSGGLLFDRQVKRIVTPGTLIDEHFLTPYENNFLLAIETPKSAPGATAADIGLAWLDLSSGAFYVQTVEADRLSSAIARIRPKEMLVDYAEEASADNHILEGIANEDSCSISPFVPHGDRLTSADWADLLDDTGPELDLSLLSTHEIAAANLLLQYVKEQLLDFKLRLQPPVRQSLHDFMSIDRNTLRGLEIMRTSRDGNFHGSLLHAIRRTSTESGARLLARRLTAPSTSLEIINGRLDLVESLLEAPVLRDQLVSRLKQTSDTLRLVQRFALGRGDAGDLLNLARTVLTMRRIADLLQADVVHRACLLDLANGFQWAGPVEMAEDIHSSIDEEGLSLQEREETLDEAEAAATAREVIDDEAPGSEDMADLQKRLSSKKLHKWADAANGRLAEDDIWIMRRDANETLETLHANLDALKHEKMELERHLQQKYSAPTLTLRWTPGQGHFVHVKGKTAALEADAAENPRSVGSKRTTKNFHITSWTALGDRIEVARSRVRAREAAMLDALRDRVVANLVKLRRNAAVLDELDVACSSAALAAEHGLVRPALDLGCDLAVHGGRHLTVENNLRARGRSFEANDCVLAGDARRVWLITGPNMAGKSTFLRQTAIISILAQTGAFVPAGHAALGVADAVFSRVGSADDVSRDRSTFMVEMLETAEILRHATRRSLVIMDEVGRGTTPEDGVAVGYAVLEHLVRVNGSRVLFATHFHRLADLTAGWGEVARRCTRVREEGAGGGAFWFDRKLREGVNRASHALKVARLARMPERVIEVAAKVLVEEEKGGEGEGS